MSGCVWNIFILLKRPQHYSKTNIPYLRLNLTEQYIVAKMLLAWLGMRRKEIQLSKTF